MAGVEKAIVKAVGNMEALNDHRNVVLVLDGLDLLLASTGCEVQEVLDMIAELREVRHCLKPVASCCFLRETARLRYDYRLSCRPAPFSVAHHASRNIPRSFRDELSAPGEVHHERKGTRYRRGEGCEWRFEDY